MVEVDVPSTLPEVAADPGLLERVIANLVENALRHTPPDKPVRITASAIGDVVEVRVTENGVVRHFAVSGGFAEIRDDKVALFAETAEMADQIDAERARQALEKAKEELETLKKEKYVQNEN